MTAIAVAHPHAVHTRIAKAAAGALLLTAACVGVWHGTQAALRHYEQPTGVVSYASPDAIAATLSGAWHTPATMGDFRPAADISGGNVVSVVKAVQ